MNRRRWSIVAALAVVTLVALAGFLLLRDGEGEDAALARMSARERPFEMPVPRQLGIAGGPENTGEALLVAERRASASSASRAGTVRPAGARQSGAPANGR